MPDLPTITVSVEQQARILAALKDVLGTTTTPETVAAYRRWLAGMLKDVVFQYEAKTLQTQMRDLKTQIDATAIDPVP